MQDAPLLRNRRFLVLWFGQAVSNLGDPFSALAIAWLVYQVTGSKLALGGVLVAHYLPLAALRLVSGPLVDRWDRRRTALAADLVRAVALFALALSVFSSHAAMWELYAVSAVTGIAEAFFQPALFALLPSLVAPEQLVRANGLTQTTFQVANLAGPALAGLVVAVLGAPVAILADAVSFAVSTCSLLLLPPAPPGARRAGGSLIRATREALAFFSSFPALFWLLAVSGSLNLGAGMVYALGLPFARDVLHVGAAGYGLLLPAVYAGGFLGSVAATAMGHTTRRRMIMLGSGLLNGLTLAAVGLVSRMSLVLLLLAATGFGIGVWNVFSGAIYQILVPDRLRGRVQSIRLLLAQGTMPLGLALGAVLGQWLGLRTAIVLTGALPLLVVTLAAIAPVLAAVDGDLAPVARRMAARAAD